MKITSAEFKKGITGFDEILEDGIPQIAFVGRSNVGKSSVINTLVNKGNLARSSATPGRTREINFYLINKEFYLVDLPGYGFASGSLTERKEIQQLIYWYLLGENVDYNKVILIIDAKIGATENDMAMLHSLNEQGKNLVVVANKIDKIKKTDLKKQLDSIKQIFGKHKVIPYSAEEKIGISELANELTGSI
jgi:GTP-binding protein